MVIKRTLFSLSLFPLTSWIGFPVRPLIIFHFCMLLSSWSCVWQQKGFSKAELLSGFPETSTVSQLCRWLIGCKPLELFTNDFQETWPWAFINATLILLAEAKHGLTPSSWVWHQVFRISDLCRGLFFFSTTQLSEIEYYPANSSFEYTRLSFNLVCSWKWPETHDSPASPSHMLGLYMCHHTLLSFAYFPLKVWAELKKGLLYAT